MRTLVVGDIHGAHRALEQCLERCDFDPLEDTLISLGDLCDGWPYVKETIDILQAIPNFKLIIGNHDDWAITWARTDGLWQDLIWVEQGGKATLKSFWNHPCKFPLDWFLEEGALIYESEGQVFVHGGIDPNQLDLQKQDKDTCMWDRDLIRVAREKHYQKPEFKYGGWKDIFVGHTTTEMGGSLEPLHYCNVWMLDTGAGWSGKLTVMDVDTKVYWQSDIVKSLYPNIKGR